MCSYKAKTIKLVVLTSECLPWLQQAGEKVMWRSLLWYKTNCIRQPKRRLLTLSYNHFSNRSQIIAQLQGLYARYSLPRQTVSAYSLHGWAIAYLCHDDIIPLSWFCKGVKRLLWFKPTVLLRHVAIKAVSTT